MAATNTTTTTTTTTSVRNGTQLVVDTTANTQSVGNFVTDVSIQPYINSRIVSFYAFNLRPSQRMHIFFDSVQVDAYCAPGTKTFAGANPDDTSDYNQIARTGNWGDAIYSNANGEVFGQFNIPAGKFKTGDRLLQICDVDSLALGSTAYTTIASATFTASNLNVTKQGITLTTVNPEIRFVPVQNTIVNVATNTVITQIPDIINVRANAIEPIAQALTINTPQNESGIFATSLEIYFKQRSQVYDHGVTVYLCETDNGYPNGNAVLPFSRVHLPYSNISISNDASVSTKFTFESPVFMSNKSTYAFVVKPDANDPDYFVWSANLGDIDVASNNQVFSQPAVGTAFFGATETQWTALQTEYIKFKLNRASFQHNSGNAIFNNANSEYLTIFNVGYSNTSVGILPGDIVFESTDSLSNSVGGTVNTSIKATVNYYDSVKGILYCDLSTGNFTPNTFAQIHRFVNTSVSSSPNNLTLIAYANTGPIYNPGLNAFVPQFATISPPGTTLSFNYKGTSNNYTIDSDEYKVNLGYETEFYDYERLVASKTNEVDYMSSNKSVTIKAAMTTDTEYLSPVIDTVRNQELVIKNDIDPIEFKYNEFFNSGNTKSKYISQIVTLAPGQDAEDLQVLLTGFKPVNSDIQVWVKFLSKEDSRPISQQTWSPMVNDSYNTYSDPSNPEDYRELQYSVGSFYSKISTTGTITAANTSNTITGTGSLFQTELQPGWFINMTSSQQPLLNTTSTYAITANTTGFSNTSDVLFITNANTNFSVNTRIYYTVPASNTAIAGLTANTYYYVSFANTSAIALSTTAGGSNVNITDARTTNPGESHTLYREDLLELQEQSRKIVSITSNTSLVLERPFYGNYTNESYFLVAPPTTAWLSTNSISQITGTVSTYTTNNSIIGVGTSFTTELLPGNIINVANDSQTIVSISNATHLTVGSPWSSNATGANAYLIEIPGLTYLNEDLNLFTTFNQFQLKIILQSDDSSKSPRMDDLRVLALQM